MTNTTESNTTFGNLIEHQFFMLDGLTLCKFGKYGFGLDGNNKVARIIEPETLVKKIEIKDLFAKKNT